MALNPLISLQTRAPDVMPALQNFQSSLTSVQNRRIQDEQNERAAELAPFQSALLQAQATRQEQLAKQEKEQARQLSVIQGANQLLPFLQNGDELGAVGFLESRKQSLIQQGLPTQDTDDAINLINTNPQLLLERTQHAVNVGRQMQQGSAGIPTATRDRNSLFAILNNPNASEDEKRAARVDLGIEGRATGAAPQIVDIGGVPHVFNKQTGKLAPVEVEGKKVTTESVAESEGIIKESEESGKLKAQLKFKPQIQTAVKLAEKAATERGDVLNDLDRASAAMPGLLNAVGQLRELATVATSTFGGRVFDSAVKETGFGATKGSTARAKFIAIINNQVLPLLKPTFGAAFTVQEGESLKATMGDPNASPDEKLAQLDAFIDQKFRDIQTKQTQVGATDLSDEDLFN